MMGAWQRFYSTTSPDNYTIQLLLSLWMRYHWVMHAIASLLFRVFGVTTNSSYAMLSEIQNMRFFLCAAFGDSKELVGACVELKTQGYMQGNGAAPASWAIVSIAIMIVHKWQGHGVTFLCPITNAGQNAVAIMYVDDTDLLHLNMSMDESVQDTHAALQGSINSWSQLLIVTGRSLKPEKCFYYLISYDWKRDSTWTYCDNQRMRNFGVAVILPD
jgi:hypothetical protein